MSVFEFPTNNLMKTSFHIKQEIYIEKLQIEPRFSCVEFTWADRTIKQYPLHAVPMPTDNSNISLLSCNRKDKRSAFPLIWVTAILAWFQCRKLQDNCYKDTSTLTFFCIGHGQGMAQSQQDAWGQSCHACKMWRSLAKQVSWLQCQ